MNRRLVLTAATILGCFAVIFFLGMVSAYRMSLEQALNKRLIADSRVVVATAQWHSGGLTISERLEDSRFDVVESDFIALVFDRDGNLIWRSASSGDFFPKYKPQSWSRDGEFSRFMTGKGYPDYYLYDRGVELGGQQFTVVTGDDTGEIDAGVRAYRRQLGIWLTASIGALLLVVTGGLLWALKPLRRFHQQMRDVEKGNMAQLDEDYPSEIQPLARGLNRLLHAERARQDRFQARVADLAHGLKTPLAVISDTADTALGEERRTLQEQVQHMNQLITYHLQRARAAPGNWAQPTTLGPLLTTLCHSLDKIYRHKNLQWDVEVGGLAIHMAEGQVLEIFGNLLENAFRLCVSTVVVRGGIDGERVAIRVSDDGPGLPAAQAEKLFRRSDRADRIQGQGIGLSVVMDMLEEAGGELSVQRAEIGGAEFVVYLPLTLLPDNERRRWSI